MSDEPTLPPIGPKTPRNIGIWLWNWSHIHTAAASAILGLLGGFILGKLL